MKIQELIIPCLLAGAAGGVVSAVVTSLLLEPPRGESAPLERSATAAPADPALDATRLAADLDELRLSDSALSARMTDLESRLALTVSTREPVERAVEDERSRATAEVAAALGLDPTALSPTFVASVDQALSEIRAREEREREARRKELLLERLDERLVELQQDLGLTNPQVREMRSALITQDDKRSALWESMREEGDRRTIFEGMRTIRDETHTALKAILTPEQFESYVQTEEGDFRRRGFGGREGGPDGPEGFPGGFPPGGGR